jgi:hypothetical protein
MDHLPQILPAVFMATLALADEEIMFNYDFDDDDGTYLQNGASYQGAPGEWNYGVGQVEAGNLNYGYTKNDKFTEVDDSPDTLYRGFKFVDSDNNSSPLNKDDMTEYTFTVEFSSWDLSRAWDDSFDSEAGKGIQLILKGGTTVSNAVVGFETFGDGGFSAFSQTKGEANYISNSSGSNYEWLNRVSDSGGVLQINGNLETGDWTAQAKDGGDYGAQWQTLGGGGGVTQIRSITLAAMAPSAGSWGGASDESGDGDFVGDHMLIDSMTLISVPEPSSYALLAGMLALASVIVRRRQ